MSTIAETRARNAKDVIFREFKETKSLCAGFVYKMAKYFMKGEITTSGSGNMGTQSYYNGISSLGYTQAFKQTGMTQTQVQQKITNGTYPPGTVICYQCTNGGNSNENYVKYGHTQFYIGGPKNSPYSFPSSLKNNYGQVMVYSYPSGWEMRIFTPNGEGVGGLQCSAPVNYNSNGTGHEMYQVYNAPMNDNDRNTNGKNIYLAMKDLGFSDNQALAFAGCTYQESRWNPTEYSKNPEAHDYGLAQWTTTSYRQQELIRLHPNDWKTANAQIEFMKYELTNQYKATNGGTVHLNKLGDYLRANPNMSLEQSVWTIVCWYEMCNVDRAKTIHPSDNDTTYHYSNRLKYAKVCKAKFIN